LRLLKPPGFPKQMNRFTFELTEFFLVKYQKFR
jgi:hypothetical protein